MPTLQKRLCNKDLISNAGINSLNLFKKVIFALTLLLRSELCGDVSHEYLRAAVPQELLPAVLALSRYHNIPHIAADALEHHDIIRDDRLSSAFKREKLLSICRYERISHELARLESALDEAGIYFMPLKGAALRDFYPLPRMRSSSDIDLLVRPSQLDAAVETVTSALSARKISVGTHDVKLITSIGVPVELHFSLIENAPAVDAVFSRVWEESVSDTAVPHKQVMSAELCCIYLILHTAKHFRHGGCGMRPIMDLWVLRERVGFDEKAVKTQLQSCGLQKFHESLNSLCDVWFKGMEHDPLTESTALYICSAGANGSVENRVAGARRLTGKHSYAARRVFLPYDLLAEQYPVLKKRRYLTSLYQIRRWVRIIKEGGTKSALRELRTNRRLSQTRLDTVAALYNSLGL